MPERFLKLAAVAALAGFSLVLASPLALALASEDGRGCRRGHCCCAKPPATGGPCVRTTCRCGDGGPVAVTPSLDEGLLPAPVGVGKGDERCSLAAVTRPLPPAPDLAPPDHPPPSILSTL